MAACMHADVEASNRDDCADSRHCIVVGTKLLTLLQRLDVEEPALELSLSYSSIAAVIFLFFLLLDIDC